MASIVIIKSPDNSNNNNNLRNNSHQNKNEPVFVTAIPVSQPPVVQGYASPLVETGVNNGLENERYGICRRCRRQFERPRGVNDGQAQYYSCPECAGIKLSDLLFSCVIS
mmetsp:Transcript_2982/g.2641  ORF Transcript_2982/g.2641 Transcript_2982/m.2641 type:complete len:110 (-) Transcript_2982:137-466(-)